ncbi:MAG: FKBP-type peptidyl-prolyl cis-trans isomerase [Hymenobacteraceae bacterium]|nr:FKBP-type peptidyl-prolyl cis-trans isomerase [Hymenobacteraceae bacterium]
MLTRFILRFFPVGTGLIFVLLLLGGCKKDTVPAIDTAALEAQKKTDDDLIKAYIAAQNLAATRTASGLYYVVETAAPAGAPLAVNGKTVTLHYRGHLLNGTADGSQFDSSYTRGIPFSFTVGAGEVIAGWDEGVQLMRKGEKGRLIIPSYLGYGPRGSVPKIPGNAVLIFYMSLENVQ